MTFATTGNSPIQEDKNEKFLLAFNLTTPAGIIVKHCKISYQVGYGKTEIEHLIKKDVLDIQQDQKIPTIKLIDINKLDYSKNLTFAYDVVIKMDQNGKNKIVKGGGGNFIKLDKQEKQIKIITLFFSYDDMKDNLTFFVSYD